MKALEKDRDRRYETASALAADVQRYLADEPVRGVPAVGAATGCGSSCGGIAARCWRRAVVLLALAGRHRRHASWGSDRAAGEAARGADATE